MRSAQSAYHLGRLVVVGLALVAIAAALYLLPPSASRPSGAAPGLRRGLIKQ